MPDVDVIQPIADAIAALADGVGLRVPDGVWTVGSVHPPAAEIELPDMRRTAPEESESQLGWDDWDLDFPVTIWVDLNKPTEAQVRLKDYLEAFISAVDADRSLGLAVNPQVVDASVLSADRVYAVGERSRALVGYETVVAVQALVPSS